MNKSDSEMFPATQINSRMADVKLLVPGCDFLVHHDLREGWASEHGTISLPSKVYSTKFELFSVGSVCVPSDTELLVCRVKFNLQMRFYFTRISAWSESEELHSRLFELVEMTLDLVLFIILLSLSVSYFMILFQTK